MNAPQPTHASSALPDVQSNPDARNLAIQRVGIKDLLWPMSLQRADGSVQATVAQVDLYVALPAEIKGTHMSRFIELLQAQHAPLSTTLMPTLMSDMLQRLEAHEGGMEFRFPLFLQKTAPVSGAVSLMNYQATLRAEQSAGQFTLTQKVVVPVTSLCPCSKKIADYGAHNQRTHITITAQTEAALSLENLIAVAENSASAQLYGILKRPDEKYVTERAYDNPKFVEDLVRDLALAVSALPNVRTARIEAENFESIHNHSAYACIEIPQQ